MIKLKNSELQSVLLTLGAYDSETGQPVSGLMYEEIPMSLRRKLQKIQKATMVALTSQEEHIKELKEKFKDDEDQLTKETEILMAEEVSVDAEEASLEFIERIVTNKNYQFEIMEKFAK